MCCSVVKIITHLIYNIDYPARKFGTFKTNKNANKIINYSEVSEVLTEIDFTVGLLEIAHIFQNRLKNWLILEGGL
jgi:hypothetical protein